MKKLSLYLALSLPLLIQGCMTPIGKEEFTCPNQKKGGVCDGPRKIYELTNTRENLEDIAKDPNYDGYVVVTDEDGNSVAQRREKVPQGQSPSKTVRGMADPAPEQEPVVYEPRKNTQHSAKNYQAAKPLPQVRSAQPAAGDDFESWPTSTEPLAPEPLAVLEPPKVMRVLVASYKDARGNLNMPGYVFVQVEAETWSIGEAANIRPQRVVPAKVTEKAKQETTNQEKRKLGVSPIETTTPGVQ